MAKHVWSLYKEDNDGKEAAHHLYDNPRDAVAVARRANRMDSNREGGAPREELRLGKNARMYTRSDYDATKYVVTKQPLRHFAFR